MTTLTQRAYALRNVALNELPPFNIIELNGLHFAMFADEEDIREFDRKSPLFAGFDTVLLHGSMPAFFLGLKH